MRAWIISLFAAVLAVSLLELLLPERGGRSTRRYVHLLTALVLLVMLAQPLLSLVRGGSDFLSGELPEGTVQTDYEAIFRDAVTHRSRQELEKGLHALLLEQYGIATEDATLFFTFDADGTLTQVRVILSGKALLVDPAPIEQELTQRFGCTVEVR
ncbi:MAG: stage III sporulation protein AF [Clostridia bacterium]|nr:stage III sporulation protein AF [Clostridia bacterium]